MTETNKNDMNYQAPLISIVLPAYNEEKNIKTVVEKILNFFTSKGTPHEIIIVDDGSTDNTAAISKALTKKNPAVQMVMHEYNQGKGAAVQSGMRLASGELIFFLDADGSTPVEEIEKLIPYFTAYEVVIGSRYLKDSAILIKQPWYRVALGRLGNTLIQRILLPGIQDTQCGCKGFQKQAAHAIFSRQRTKGWGFDMEILALSRALGYRIKEVAVSWHDTRDRMSRFRPFKDAIKTLYELVHIKTNLIRDRYRLSSKKII